MASVQGTARTVPRQWWQVHRFDRDITCPLEDLTTGVVATAAVLPGAFPIAVQNVKLSRPPAIKAGRIRHTERTFLLVSDDLRPIFQQPRTRGEDQPPLASSDRYAP